MRQGDFSGFPLWYDPRPMRLNSFLLFLLVVAATSLASFPAHGQSALQDLLSRIPQREAGDNNRYSLTDVQYALRARLDWNALLRRAKIVEEESGLSFTLVVGSPLGSCSGTLVEWPQAPTMRNGQIYVSEGLLSVVFNAYPDFRFPGSEGQEEELDLPPIATLEEMALEEPPSLYTEEAPKSLKKVAALFLTSGSAVSASTGDEQSADPARALQKQIEEAVQQGGLSLETQVLNQGESETFDGSGDALLSFRIITGTPAPASSFFYYDAPSLPSQARGHGLVEWDRTTPQQRGASRVMAESIHRNFTEQFGPDRSAGVRGGPISILQGQRIPSVQVNFGVSPASQEMEFKKLAEVVRNSLSQIKEEG